MNYRRLWPAATIVALVIIGGFILSVPHTRDIPAPRVPPALPPVVPAVTLRDVFKKGVHTISGSVMAPTACAVVTPTATLAGTASSTQHIAVSLSMPKDTGICLQVPTVAKFQTTLAAPAHLTITITVNGSPATTTTP